MGLFDVSEEKRRAKEIKRRSKELRRGLLEAGLDKKWTDAFLEELSECLEEACLLKESYSMARKHIISCFEMIEGILPDMRSMGVSVCRAQLQKILAELPQVYHECLIRRDDLDFESTMNYMKKAVPVYNGEERLMMQSELENLLAVFSDAKEWAAPDFVELAYFVRNEKRELLADIENSQRNAYIKRVYNEKFWNESVEHLASVKWDVYIKDFINDIEKEIVL